MPHTPTTLPSFPIVALGASAGGLAAFEAFFKALPPRRPPVMAFVLLQHLDPDHKSLLVELVQGFTSLEVVEATQAMPLRSRKVYVIPPGQNLSLLNGLFHLEVRPLHRLPNRPIDLFFTSLARSFGHRAVAIVLSGTGSDGTLGAKAIRKAGGLVLVQSVESAEFDGMPRSVIESGQIDAVLEPSQMLKAITHHLKVSPPLASPLPPLEPLDDPVSLARVFALLKQQTAHDFSHYKESSVRRRLDRRLLASQCSRLSDYADLLETDKQEVKALFQDLLIGVTSFFRDPTVFAVLEDQVIPRLVAEQPEGIPIRAWCAGCSTGEEAYSLSILFHEGLAEAASPATLQIFASDIDPEAIESARLGVYSTSIADCVSEIRLKKSFALDPSQTAYKVRKEVRNSVVFSEHDVLKDPPFSKLNLLSCRNVFIYLGAELQRQLLPLFHSALKPGGFLVLGTSETIWDFGHLFQLVDRQGKIYQRREISVGPHPDSPLRTPPPLRSLGSQGPLLPTQPRTQPSVKEITEQAILRMQDRAGALVDAQGQILYLHGKTGQFLEPNEGVPAAPNLLKMAKPGLTMALATALHHVVTDPASVVVQEIPLLSKSGTSLVQLTVQSVSLADEERIASPLFLVVMEERTFLATPSSDSATWEDEHLKTLARDAALKDEYIRITAHQMTASITDLRASNEELQSLNEELQSTNEELDTSKEELQSVNEELYSVNAELGHKVAELTRNNNDMNNLLAATSVATIFVDRGCRILRFTPEATRIINLIPADVGRPIGHLASNLLNYQELEADTQTVLDTLNRFEIEVQRPKESGSVYASSPIGPSRMSSRAQ